MHGRRFRAALAADTLRRASLSEALAKLQQLVRQKHQTASIWVGRDSTTLPHTVYKCAGAFWGCSRNEYSQESTRHRQHNLSRKAKPRQNGPQRIAALWKASLLENRTHGCSTEAAATRPTTDRVRNQVLELNLGNMLGSCTGTDLQKATASLMCETLGGCAGHFGPPEPSKQTCASLRPKLCKSLPARLVLACKPQPALDLPKDFSAWRL